MNFKMHKQTSVKTDVFVKILTVITCAELFDKAHFTAALLLFTQKVVCELGVEGGASFQYTLVNGVLFLVV